MHRCGCLLSIILSGIVYSGMETRMCMCLCMHTVYSAVDSSVPFSAPQCLPPKNLDL